MTEKHPQAPADVFLWTSDLLKQVRDMRRAGHSFIAIGASTGIDPAVVERVLGREA